MIPDKYDVRVLLADVRSVHNVGSIFRTAETLGVSRIYCTGVTPAPLDRFGRKRKDLAKVALGAEDMVPWEYVENAVGLAKSLRDQGLVIIALEQAPESIDYKDVAVGKDRGCLIILGNEVGGVPPELTSLSHVVAEIPMRGTKESLNVSVAAGIFLYRLLDS